MSETISARQLVNQTPEWWEAHDVTWNVPLPQATVFNAMWSEVRQGMVHLWVNRRNVYVHPDDESFTVTDLYPPQPPAAPKKTPLKVSLATDVEIFEAELAVAQREIEALRRKFDIARNALRYMAIGIASGIQFTSTDCGSIAQEALRKIDDIKGVEDAR